MRGKRAPKRKLEPDPIYGNRQITRFVNRLMNQGKKTVAQKIVYGALGKISQQNKDPIVVFETALKNISPKLEVKPRRIGGASYQVPMEVRGDRKEALAIRWLITSAKARSTTECPTMIDKLAAELLDAYQNQGGAVKKKENTHRMAEANKAFAHFRW
ncbi:MAG: 30S ribosomal protein S7 [Candidatus Woykebacteria bacterium RIFCSPHIGHO2_01_FULL_39_12]|uniref:Small ribosomal subunit protein uS7 n=1 Tax=Candidatus Woykebacteria bacterium RIFCSPHIGHO2_01_FULL_39_12 TaxID=1802599 RepID=A0A1G1WIV8_9BACT|nr:MAG: 30S ribosomal protein S7 [Candidatus Woykebacteria bacterium RIFCSPHIGHO2_01_FULL_39_12]